MRRSQEASFAMFDGINLDPLDARGKLVGMNCNGTRDRRGSVEQAWRRIGLRKANESFTRPKHVACATQAAMTLAKEGLLPARMVNHYARAAQSMPLNQFAC